MRRKTDIKRITVEYIKEFLTDYELFSGQEAEDEAQKMALWICSVIDSSDEFPTEEFEHYLVTTSKGTFIIHVLFDSSLDYGSVTLMPDMYGIIPENSPNYVVMDVSLVDGQYEEDGV